jgi:hypothetical protein
MPPYLHPQSAGWCRVADIAFARLSREHVESNLAAWAQGIEGLPGFAQPFDLLPMLDAEIAPSERHHTDPEPLNDDEWC